MSRSEEDWSDSDGDESQIETQVFLGIPEGEVKMPQDLTDVTISRIGGRPAFLLSIEPPLSSSQCGNCSSMMRLLVQLWCPLEDSPMDRAFIRAWRALKYNEKFDSKLRKNQPSVGNGSEDNAGVVASKEKDITTNPFAITDDVAPKPFGLGSQIFGNPKISENAPDPKIESPGDSLATAVASVSLEESPWLKAPTYPPVYLSTTSEYIPTPPKSGLAVGIGMHDPESGKSKDLDWVGSEVFENSLEVDRVFERFTKRVAYEGHQCVRYDLKGTPLPFVSDKVFDLLFPVQRPLMISATKPDMAAVVPSTKRTYSPSLIPPCAICKSPRVFECQLMPNLINVFASFTPSRVPTNDEERRKLVQAELKAGGQGVMEWGTCMIFSCERDCCKGNDTAGERECWREENVLIQWDDTC